MIRRYPCFAAVLFALGICAAALPVISAGISLAVLTAVLWDAKKEPDVRRRACRILLLLLFFGAGVLRYWHASQIKGISAADGETVSLQGEIMKKQKRETQFLETQWTVHLKDCYLIISGGRMPCGKLIVYLDAVEPAIGNTISVKGTIQNFRTARNEGNFNERDYYLNQGYTYRVFADTYEVTDRKKDILKERLYGIQQRLADVYVDAMPQREAGVLSAMLLGEKTLLEENIKELYRQSGIAHILAISGLHISILGAAFFCLLKKCGCSYPAAALCSLSFIMMFGFMTGMGISTMRAVIMFALYLGAECCGRAYDSANALAVAAVCLLIYQPGFLFLAGFQFSFGAVAGVLLGKEICRIFCPKWRFLETFYISFGIQLVTLPLTAWYYFELPLYSMLLNFLVLPFMEFVLVGGLLGGAAGVSGAACAEAAFGNGMDLMLHVLGKFLHTLSKGILYADTILLRYFSKAAKLFLELPYALYVRGKPEIFQMAGHYIVLGITVFIVLHMETKHIQRIRLEKENRNTQQNHLENRKKQKAVLAIGGIMPLCLLLWKLPQSAEISVLDVGQGDGIYIHTSDNADVFIDGGSTDVSGAGTYRILPFLKSRGAAGIDYWFLSHLDADHISGFKEALESGYPVGTVILSARVLQDEAWKSLTMRIQEKGIPICYMEDGGALCGTLSCFTALVLNDADLEQDRNARSLVLLYEDNGMRGLFAGDISSKEEALLAERYDISDMTIYKAVHHGSQYSNSEILLQKIRPKISVVSCALFNDYGHPAKEAVKHMEDYGGGVFYTMNMGQISVKWDETRIWIREFLAK